MTPHNIHTQLQRIYIHLHSAPSTQKNIGIQLYSKLIFLTSYIQGEASSDYSRTATTTTTNIATNISVGTTPKTTTTNITSNTAINNPNNLV